MNARGWADNKRWITIAQRTFMLVAAGVIVAYGIANRETVAVTVSRLQLSNVILAGAIMLALHLLIISSFQCLHRIFGIRRLWRRAAFSYFWRLPGRFIPGGIWHSVMRYGDMHGEPGTTVRKLGVVFLGECLLVAATGFLAAGTMGVIQADHPISTLGRLMLAAGLAFVAALWIVCLRCRHEQLVRPFLASVALMTIVWTGAGWAFVSLSSRGVQPMLAGCDAGALAASYVGSASSGYIAVFAPQGWGVTELVLAVLQPCSSPTATLVTAVLAFRVVSMGTDALAFALAAAGHWLVIATRKPT